MSDTANPGLHQRITDAIAPMEGWCSPAKAQAMTDLILRTRPRLCVEIGVFGGRSLVPQAMALRELGSGLVVGIDPWKLEHAIEGDVGEANEDWWRNKLDLHDIHKSAIEAVWRHSLDHWCIVIRCPAHKAATLFAPESIDILHIDGCHSELASCRDVETYWPLVKGGGHVWFDDSDWESTRKAVALLDARARRLDSVGSCLLYRKP